MLKSKLRYQLLNTGFMLSFSVTLLLALFAFVSSVYSMRGQDVSKLPSSIFTVLQSRDAASYGIFRTLFPVLAILPGGLSYASDVSNGVHIYLCSRSEKWTYYKVMLLSSFLSSFIAIIIPLLLFTAFSAIIFPDIGKTPYSYYHFFMEDVLRLSGTFLIPELFVTYPVVSALLSAFAMAILAGILSVLTVCISLFYHRYQAILLLPAFLFLYAIDVFILGTTSSRQYHLLDLASISFSPQVKSNMFPLIFLAVSIILIITSYQVKVRDDVF